MSETSVERARRGFEAARRGDPTARGSCRNRKQALTFRRHYPNPDDALAAAHAHAGT